jgi:hypothetical protein
MSFPEMEAHPPIYGNDLFQANFGCVGSKFDKRCMLNTGAKYTNNYVKLEYRNKIMVCLKQSLVL